MIDFTFDRLMHVKPEQLKKQKLFCTVLAVLFFAAGFVCLFFPLSSSLGASLLAGWLFLLSGILQIAATISFREVGSVWSVLLGIVIACAYLFLGYAFISDPAAGVLSISLFIGVAFLTSGVLRGVVFLTSIPATEGKWLFLVSALIEVLLGVIIISSWPASSALWVSTFLGVQFISNSVRFWLVRKSISTVLSR